MNITTRRNFLSTAALAVGAALTQKAPAQTAAPQFVLRYAPHPDMFKHHAGPDVLDQIRFAADQGFTAWEHNPLSKETPEMQEKIGALLAEKKMQMGVFIAFSDFDRPVFTVKREEFKTEVLTAMKSAVEVAKRVGAKWMTVVPGSIDQQHKDDAKWNKYGGPRLAEGYQMANVIELLRGCAEILEPHGLVMVLEALNTQTNHGGVFLTRADQAYALCKAVNSPSCKFLFDMYHMQIEGGNVIPNLDACWDEIGYLQSGDNPGRKEPGTGEMHYGNIFRHIKAKGFQGVIGMEHGNAKPGKDGETALIAAYRSVDPT